MRLKTITIAALLTLAAFFCFDGCASTPTKTETKLFDIKTNFVQIVTTNTVWKTNEEIQRIQQIIPTPSGSVTNFVQITNATPIAVPVPVTNYEARYEYTPNKNAAAIGETGGAIGNFFGVGGVASTVIMGIFGIWAKWRGRGDRRTAETLSQIIETGSEVLKAVPNGVALDAAWKQWMQQHQAETGTIGNVMGILKNVTDNSTAQKAATEIQDIIGAVRTASLPPIPPTPPPTPLI